MSSSRPQQKHLLCLTLPENSLGDTRGANGIKFDHLAKREMVNNGVCDGEAKSGGIPLGGGSRDVVVILEWNLMTYWKL